MKYQGKLWIEVIYIMEMDNMTRKRNGEKY